MMLGWSAGERRGGARGTRVGGGSSALVDPGGCGSSGDAFCKDRRSED